VEELRAGLEGNLTVRFLTVVPLVCLAAGCASDDTVNPNPEDEGEGPAPEIFFEDRTEEAGFRIVRIPPPQPSLENFAVAGGVAAGDMDADGDIDLFLVSEGSGDNLLYRNNGDGTFTEVGAQYGVSRTPIFDSGPIFADYDGDGHLDLIVGGVRQLTEWNDHNSVLALRNTGAQSFVDATMAAGLTLPPELDTYSITLGDIDGDDHLDLFLSHWRIGGGDGIGDEMLAGHFLWRNNGNGSFVDVTDDFGLGSLELTFTANFSDVDTDGDLDLLIVNDFQKSKVFLNGGETFVEEPSTVLSDGNGMGASVGDYDNDGDLDWFVTSIWDPNGVAEGNWDMTGNRLYQNDGGGRFTDVSMAAGVREGFWGWASCFADFNNDGYLDLFHVNGMRANDNTIYSEYWLDPSRLFVSNGDGTFTERSMEFGPSDAAQGRGVVCFDADRDGDIDIFVANNGQSPNFYMNEATNVNNYLQVVLRGARPNTQGIGAQITITAVSGQSQLREIRAGSNYVSQDPAEAHFGLGQVETVDVSVRWPDGQLTVLPDVAANQLLVVSHPGL
jgi:hypothetical protein